MALLKLCPPEKKRDAFRELMPMLMKHPVIAGAIFQYLEGDRVLEISTIRTCQENLVNVAG